MKNFGEEEETIAAGDEKQLGGINKPCLNDLRRCRTTVDLIRGQLPEVRPDETGDAIDFILAEPRGMASLSRERMPELFQNRLNLSGLTVVSIPAGAGLSDHNQRQR